MGESPYPPVRFPQSLTKIPSKVTWIPGSHPPQSYQPIRQQQPVTFTRPQSTNHSTSPPTDFRGHLLRESTFAETYSAKVHHTSNTLKHTLNMHTHTRHTAAPKERGKRDQSRAQTLPKAQVTTTCALNPRHMPDPRGKGKKGPQRAQTPPQSYQCHAMQPHVQHSKTLKHSTKHASPKHAHTMHPRRWGKGMTPSPNPP